MIQTDSEMQTPLTDTERAVIDYINQHENSAAALSITELADASFTSPATVSRAIRKCGFSGIPELRRYLAAHFGKQSAPYRMNEILEKSFKECTSTIENLKITDILKIVDHMKAADRIYVLARGVTALTAEEFCFQLHLQKYNAVLVTDSELMKRMDKLADRRDLIIIFTAFNSTPEFVSAARLARQRGCSVVTCCCKEHTPLEEASDITVIGYSLPIVDGNQFDAASRVPLQIIARTIVEYLAN